MRSFDCRLSTVNCRLIVELEGVEPSSKQIAEVLSTRLAACWLSDKASENGTQDLIVSP